MFVFQILLTRPVETLALFSLETRTTVKAIRCEYVEAEFIRTELKSKRLFLHIIAFMFCLTLFFFRTYGKSQTVDMHG